MLLWNCGAVGVPPGLSPHATQYYHKEVAEAPAQRTDSPSDILGDEFRITGTRHSRGTQSVQVALTPSE